MNGGGGDTRRNEPTTVEIPFDDRHGDEIESILNDAKHNLNLSETEF